MKLSRAGLLCILFIFIGLKTDAQQDNHRNLKVSLADEIRGALRPERNCFDVTYYHLNIRINPADKSISGAVVMEYLILDPCTRMQIDLYRNMNIDRIELDGLTLEYEWVEDAVFVTVPENRPGDIKRMTIFYAGIPQEAKNAPWDGGFVWKADAAGRPWIGVACQGDGASLWWPCKDHLSDEPDSMLISFTVPDTLIAVGNGILVAEKKADAGWKRFDWKVSYPINTYNISANIAAYRNFKDKYYSPIKKDTLILDYYVLEENFVKAEKHFKQVHGVLAAFEHYFGPYPFWEDSYKLVETPYLGMEHQSAIAYGNLYRRGYLGGGIPADMDFDYIIVHETGHEYFGNAVSVSDLADMWIHESFTTYMESLFIEYHLGYEAAMRYLMHQRAWIADKQPIIGKRGVNWYKQIKSSDQYYKGAWILNTLRHIVGDDKKWFGMLRAFYEKYEYKVIISEDFFHFAEAYFEMDLDLFFKQYLYSTEIPEFQYKLKKRKDGWHMSYRIKSKIKSYSMPVVFKSGNTEHTVLADGKWKEMWVPIQNESDIQFIHSRYLVYYKKI
jgi:aminopeptidase N